MLTDLNLFTTLSNYTGIARGLLILSMYATLGLWFFDGITDGTTLNEQVYSYFPFLDFNYQILFMIQLFLSLVMTNAQLILLSWRIDSRFSALERKLDLLKCYDRPRPGRDQPPRPNPLGSFFEIITGFLDTLYRTSRDNPFLLELILNRLMQFLGDQEKSADRSKTEETKSEETKTESNQESEETKTESNQESEETKTESNQESEETKTESNQESEETKTESNQESEETKTESNQESEESKSKDSDQEDGSIQSVE